jgi:hypothetical protein
VSSDSERKAAEQARAWVQTKYPSDVKMVGEVTNPERESDFIDGYNSALKDLEQIAREAFNAGQKLSSFKHTMSDIYTPAYTFEEHWQKKTEGNLDHEKAKN